MNNIKLLIEVLTKIYSSSYNGGLDEIYGSKDANIVYGENSFTISSFDDNVFLPTVHVSNMKSLDTAIENYFEAVRSSNTGYNIYTNPEFINFGIDNMNKLVIETLLWNANSLDLNNLENFFDRYTKFILDDTFNDVKKNKYMGNVNNDKLYLMAKRNSLSFETPYYLDFMLAKSHYELPYMRIGVADNTAYLKAIQSNEETSDNKEINDFFKRIIPKTNEYRFFSPNHLISIVLTLSFLESKGINDIVIDDYLPIRLYHYIKERNLNSDEINNFQLRLTNEHLNTFFKVITISDGIEVTRFNADGTGLCLHFENVYFKNEELNNLYNLKQENFFKRL